MAGTRLPDIIQRHEADLLAQWNKALIEANAGRDDLIPPDELRRQSTEMLSGVRTALKDGGSIDHLESAQWAHTREFLSTISASRAIQGFSPSETVRFVLSLKEPLFQRLRIEYATNPSGLSDELWTLSRLFDNLALVVSEAYIKARESVIKRQQESMLEHSTPVVKLWDGILALPLIGTLDSARTQVVMESLLQRVVTESTDVVIIDITGVPTVDTLVAQHLLKTVTAARLMGTDCIISGIRPQIAQTIVHLGVDLTSVVTKASLADAFKIALTRRNLTVVTRKSLERAQAVHPAQGT